MRKSLAPAHMHCKSAVRHSRTLMEECGQFTDMCRSPHAVASPEDGVNAPVILGKAGEQEAELGPHSYVRPKPRSQAAAWSCAIQIDDAAPSRPAGPAVGATRGKEKVSPCLPRSSTAATSILCWILQHEIRLGCKCPGHPPCLGISKI